MNASQTPSGEQRLTAQNAEDRTFLTGISLWLAKPGVVFVRAYFDDEGVQVIEIRSTK